MNDYECTQNTDESLISEMNVSECVYVCMCHRIYQIAQWQVITFVYGTSSQFNTTAILVLLLLLNIILLAVFIFFISLVSRRTFYTSMFLLLVHIYTIHATPISNLATTIIIKKPQWQARSIYSSSSSSSSSSKNNNNNRCQCCWWSIYFMAIRTWDSRIFYPLLFFCFFYTATGPVNKSQLLFICLSFSLSLSLSLSLMSSIPPFVAH